MMNSQTTKDITGFRSYFPDVLRLIFEEQLSVRAIALEQLGLSHSTVHNIFQRFNASGAYFHERRSLNNFHRDRVITFEQIAE